MNNRGEIRTEVLDHLGEETTGYWSLAELNRQINRAHKTIARKARLLNREYYLTSTTISTTASTWTVDLPSDFYKMVEIRDSQNNLIRPGLRRNFDSTSSGEPSFWAFYHGSTNQICFDLTPDSVYSYTMYYIYDPSAMSSDSDEPDVPMGGDELIALCAAYNLLKVRGDDTSVEFYRNYKSRLDEWLRDIAADSTYHDKYQHGDRMYGVYSVRK